jgi:hypothetical protein
VKFISFNSTSGLLCSASDTALELIKLPGTVAESNGQKINANNLTIRTIQEELKIWSLLINKSAFKVG